MRNVRYIVCLLVVGLLFAVDAEAQRRHSSGITHGVNLMLDGGVAFPMFAPEVDNPPTVSMGGAATAALQYELTVGNFFMNVGAGVDFINSGTHYDSYTESFDRVDKQGEQIIYNYQYRDFRERQNDLAFMFPIQFGYYIRDFYVAVGGRFRMVFYETDRIHTTFFTEGIYERFLDPIENIPSFGFYPEMEYGLSHKDMGFNRHFDATVGAEFGYRIINRNRWMLRVGAFAEYGLLNQNHKEDKPLIDYSRIDTNPLTQNQADLEKNLSINRLANTRLLGDSHLNNLTFGLRVTIGLKFQKKESWPCQCYED